MIEFVGMLVITFLVSRLFIALTRKWKSGGTDRLLAANMASGLLCGTVGGFGFADGGPFAWQAFFLYGVAQACWLGFDVVRYNKGLPAEPPVDPSKPPHRGTQ